MAGLQGWVYAVVYGGFILQGAGLAVAFALHLRARWGGILGGSVGSRRPGATHGVQVMSTVAVGGLTALVVAVRLYWASGGEAGLPTALRVGRSLTQQVMDASSAALALAGLLGLVVLVSRRPRGLRAWVPLAAAWVGAGSMFCSGAYGLVILLAPGSPFEASGGRGFGLLAGGPDDRRRVGRGDRRVPPGRGIPGAAGGCLPRAGLTLYASTPVAKLCEP